MEQKKQNAVALWLIAGVVMIIIQTLLGGVTRLTGSGLSITKWNPIFGVLPPLNKQQWEDAFGSYKEIGQFKYVNSYFSLHDFKQIFFWEWLHRFWARMLFVVFAIGFGYFLVRNYFDKKMIRPFIILFILGGLQGVVGILMVFSGVNPEDVHVNYTWLAAHFISAMVLACYTLWFALKLLIPEGARTVNKKMNSLTLVAIGLLFVQLMYGAFMAGLKGAQSAATWPLINGKLIPAEVAFKSLLTDDVLSTIIINVHYMHRTIAFIFFITIVIWFMYMRRAAGRAADKLLAATTLWPVALVSVQILLGITTVLSAAHIQTHKFGLFESLAEMHQLVAMFLLMSLVVNLYVVKRS